MRLLGQHRLRPDSKPSGQARGPSRYNQLAIVTRTLSILGLFGLSTAFAQQPVVLLDPARGGAESGARIADRLPEKQVTLDTASRLASLLRARGFTVAMTRDADVDMPNDARAALANNLHPIACILLHATAQGSGVHLYISALHQAVAASGSPVRWDEAQAAYVDRSRALAADLKAALQHSRITASTGATWIRPLDNMQCPAVAVEVAPEKDGTGAEDNTYQAQVSNALANTLLQWRGKVASLVPPEPQAAPALPLPSPLPGTPKPSIASSSAAAGQAVTTAQPGIPKPTPKPVSKPAAAKPQEPATAQPDRIKP